MKNLTYLVVIIIVAVVICGCGADRMESGNYQIEKLQQQAFEAEEKVLGIKPELATDESVRELIAMHARVVDRFGEIFPDVASKDSVTDYELNAAYLAGQSQLRIGELSTLIGDSAVAMNAYEDFEEIFPKNYGQIKTAQLRLAEFYNKRENYDKVEQIYVSLIDQYDPPAMANLNPDMDILRLPYDMMRFFSIVSDSAKYEHYRDYAENYYTRLKESYQGTNLGVVSTRFLAETFKTSGNPRKAIDLLKTVVDSTGQMTKPALMLTAQAYFNDLDMPDSALYFYNKLLERPADSTYTPKAILESGQVMFLNRRFSEARQRLYNLLDNFDYARELYPQAQLFIGISYEEEGDFRSAEDAYTAVIENYPTNSLAFDTYLRLPEFFAKQDKNQMERQWYNRAEDFYKNTGEDYEDHALGVAASEYLARFYIRYEKWYDAVDALKEMLRKYPDYRVSNNALFQIASIFDLRLDMPDSAKHYYQKQIDTYPDVPVSRKAKEKLQQL